MHSFLIDKLFSSHMGLTWTCILIAWRGFLNLEPYNETKNIYQNPLCSPLYLIEIPTMVRFACLHAIISLFQNCNMIWCLGNWSMSTFLCYCPSDLESIQRWLYFDKLKFSIISKLGYSNKIFWLQNDHDYFSIHF